MVKILVKNCINKIY